MYMSGLIMKGIYTRGSWLTVSYHFVIYFYIKTLICLFTVLLINRIKDQPYHTTVKAPNTKNNGKRKGIISATTKEKGSRISATTKYKDQKAIQKQ